MNEEIELVETHFWPAAAAQGHVYLIIEHDQGKAKVVAATMNANAEDVAASYYCSASDHRKKGKPPKLYSVVGPITVIR